MMVCVCVFCDAPSGMHVAVGGHEWINISITLSPLYIASICDDGVNRMKTKFAGSSGWNLGNNLDQFGWMVFKKTNLSLTCYLWYRCAEPYAKNFVFNSITIFTFFYTLQNFRTWCVVDTWRFRRQLVSSKGPRSFHRHTLWRFVEAFLRAHRLGRRQAGIRMET